MKIGKKFEPTRNAPCLCGSGLKFKRCCAERLPGSGNLGHAAKEEFAKKDYSAALLSVRADITQYTIWHKNHTEPAIAHGAPLQKLLDIDIKALSELADELIFCYEKLGRRDELPATLEHLRQNINDIRWQRRLTYNHVLYALGPDWNKQQGRKEFKKLGNVDDETDVEILQLYADLFGDDLSHSRRSELFERIVKLTESDAERLHYRAAKAVDLLLIGDFERAQVELDKAIAAYQGSASNSGSLYAGMHLGWALALLGCLRSDQNIIDQALEVLEPMTSRDDITNSGKAELYRAIGEAYKFKSEWEKSLAANRQSLAFIDSAICHTFVAEALLHTGDTSAAVKAISEVKTDFLRGAPEEEDYVCTLAEIAVEFEDAELLTKARRGLRALDSSAPIVERRRSALFMAVIETQEKGSNQTVLTKMRRALSARINSATAYLMLRPNVMGIGIDVGKIIEDLTKQRAKNSGEQA